MPANDRPRGFMVWVADFLSDPHVAAMDATEVGAFWLLLLYAAQSDRPGTLPNDDVLLARLSRLGDRWPEHRARVLAAWVVSPRVITQKRLEQEVLAAARRQEAARESGRRGGMSRRGNELSRDPSRDPTRVAQGALQLSGSGLLQHPASPASAGEAPGINGDPESNRNAARGLLSSVAGQMRMPRPNERATKHVWDWLVANATGDEADEGMAFVGWLMKTGTRDPEMLLALTKDRIVHKPDNPHAYYTPKGMARQNIMTRVASDRAIAEHERIKREERAFLGRT